MELHRALGLLEVYATVGVVLLIGFERAEACVRLAGGEGFPVHGGEPRPKQLPRSGGEQTGMIGQRAAESVPRSPSASTTACSAIASASRFGNRAARTVS